MRKKPCFYQEVINVSLENLKELRDDMKNRGWYICPFPFSYNNIDFVVLAKRYSETKEDQKNL